MKKQKGLTHLSVLLVFAIALVFAACESQAPLSNDLDSQNTTGFEALVAQSQPVLKSGPLTDEEIEAISAPTKKVQIAESDLKIIKSIDGASLKKRFVRSWYMPLGGYGWAYAGDDLHGRCWLFFPPYAMDQSTVITIDWESTGFLEGGVELSPEGTVFNVPVPISVSYKDADIGDIDEEDLKLWYFNEDTGMWELIGDFVDTQNKIVCGLLLHFSRYAIGME